MCIATVFQVASTYCCILRHGGHTCKNAFQIAMQHFCATNCKENVTFITWPLIRCFWKYICYVRDVGLIESALDSRSRNSGFKLDQSHCVVFLGVVLLGRPDRMMWGGMGETVLDLNSFWKVALRNSLKLSVHQSSCDFCFFFLSSPGRYSCSRKV